MFFSDANNFEKYSIFGNRINKLKFNECKKCESKFEMIPFLKDLKYDVDWHEHVLDTLSEKGTKLINPNITKRSVQTTDQEKRLKYSEEKPSFPIPKPTFEQSDNYEYRPFSPKLEKENENIDVAEKTPELKEMAETGHVLPSIQKKICKTESKQVQRKKSPERSAQDNFKNPIERRAFILMKHWYPLKFKVPYPRKSLLNGYEQREFIEFYERFKNRAKISQSEVRLYKKYLHYKSQIEKEREEFFGYLQEYYKAAGEDYEFMNHSIEQYEMTSFKYGCVNKYERFYDKLFSISLNQIDENNHQKSSLQLNNNLLNMGQLHKIVVPSISIDVQPNMIIDYQRPLYEDENIEKLALKYNCGIAMTNSAFVHLIYHMSFLNSDELKLAIVIKDIQSEDGRKHKIVLLEKPFIEKYLSKRDINEKFYKKSLIVTLVKNQAGPLRNKASKVSKNSESKSSPVKEPERVLEKLNVDYNVVSNFESFGVGSPDKHEETPVEKPNETVHHTPIIIEPEKVKKRSRQSNDSVLNSVAFKKMRSNNSSDYEDYEEESDDDGLVIAEINNEKIQQNNKEEDKKTPIDQILNQEPEETDQAPLSPGADNPPPLDFIPKVIPLDKQIKSQKIETEVSKQQKEETKKTETTEDKLSLFDLISKLQDKLVEKPIAGNQPNPTHHQAPKSSQHPAENPREYNYLENVHDNLNYSLWGLDSMKILIRSSTVGYINKEHSSMNPVVIYPKMEYQPQFGCEKLTTKDYCKMWAKSFLRNYCDIYLCRINVFTNKLISVSNFKFDELLPQDLQLNTNQSLNRLRNFITKIKENDIGTYLVTKDPNKNNFNILKSTKRHRPESFDLHFYYNGFLGEDFKKLSYWMPIDFTIYLPYHFKLNRVPGLFEPQYKDIKQIQKSPEKPKKKRRKGKQNKAIKGI
ncbi:little elongation complex subunit 2 isoform X1 [Brachionus plicatilis]|uniref:Little elongation complex subunit 2 isoform X1 n=1 Tax=Brachionus plicatilis TaxID=10195 RepID=A0A3M7T9U2_BRAPC|nr:little elongation complex subunit 2 isoform X1 [Brachionus plicatilis]